MADIVGDVQVLESFLRKKTYTCSGRIRRKVLIILPGVMSGILSARALEACAERGIVPDSQSRVHALLGISAGAANALAWCSGQTKESKEVYLHLADRFFTVRHHEDFMQVEYMVQHIKEKLDHHALSKCAVPYYVSLSPESGKSAYRDMSEDSVLFEVLKAAVWVPGPFRGSVHLPDGDYVDGSCCASILEFVRDKRPHDVLVIGSRPYKIHWFETVIFPWLAHALLWQYPHELREATANMEKSMLTALQRLDASKMIRWCGIFPDETESVLPLEWRTKILKNQSTLYYENVHRIFDAL